MKRTLLVAGSTAWVAGSTAWLILIVASPDVIAQGRRGNRGGHQGRGSFGGSAIELSSQSVNETSLLKMWEEEKLARDVYISLGKTYQMRVFQNITVAENKHMQAIEGLLRAGGVNVNALNSTPGQFSVPEYKTLYDTLVVAGSRSPVDALKVGVKIEEMDIADLQRLMAQTPDGQIQRVLQHLLQGSHNHLRAFTSQLSQQGVTYQPEFLSQADFDRIVNERSEAGRGPQNGRSGKRGRNGRSQ